VVSTKKPHMTCFWSNPSGTGMPHEKDVRLMERSAPLPSLESMAMICARRSSGRHISGCAVYSSISGLAYLCV